MAFSLARRPCCSALSRPANPSKRSAILRPKRRARPISLDGVPLCLPFGKSFRLVAVAAGAKAAVMMRHGGTTLKPVLAMIVVGLTPRHLGPHAAAFGARPRWRHGPLDTVTPAVTCSVQATFMTGSAARPRHRRQRLAVPRPDGSLVLAAVQSACRRREDLGGRQAPRSRFHLRQHVLVVQHGVEPRHRRDAAADLQGRWPQASRLLHRAGTIARRLTERLGPFPLFQFWGPATTIASTRWIAEATKFVMTDHRSDADARLPAASRLRFAALRTGRDSSGGSRSR